MSMNMLRLKEEELELLQSKIKAMAKAVRVHENELRTNTGTGLDEPPYGYDSKAWYGPNAKPIENASRTLQKRSRRIPGYASESDNLKSILAYLRLHPRVSWVVRINSGALRYENRFIKFGHPGFPDIIGQTKEGLLIGIEVKSTTGAATAEQQAFIARVNASGGLGCVAKSIDDVRKLLGFQHLPDEGPKGR